MRKLRMMPVTNQFSPEVEDIYFGSYENAVLKEVGEVEKGYFSKGDIVNCHNRFIFCHEKIQGVILKVIKIEVYVFPEIIPSQIRYEYIVRCLNGKDVRLKEIDIGLYNYVIQSGEIILQQASIEFNEITKTEKELQKLKEKIQNDIS